MKYLALYDTVDQEDEDTQVAHLERQIVRYRGALRRCIQRLRRERAARATAQAASAEKSDWAPVSSRGVRCPL